MNEIDRARTERIAAEMVRAIAANYREGPTSPDRVWEALNACSYAVATVIVGTGDRDGRRAAQAFFDKALAQNVRDLIQNPP